MRDTVHTTLSDILCRAEEVKHRAKFFVSKRRKDVELYAVLADCLSICEDASRDGLVDELRQEYHSRPIADGRNRRFFFSNADVFLIIGRLVFEDQSNRAACWRYTATLREASKRKIPSSELADWLAANGGVNELFRRRPVEARSARTKTLHLNQAISIPKNKAFTLTLIRRDDGFFDVVDA